MDSSAPNLVAGCARRDGSPETYQDASEFVSPHRLPTRGGLLGLGKVAERIVRRTADARFARGGSD